MTEPTDVTLTDCRHATTALIHWLNADLEGVQEVLGAAQDSGRITAVLLATLQTMTAIAPELRDPDRIAHLQVVAAQLSIRENPVD